MPTVGTDPTPWLVAPWLVARGLVAGYLPGIDILRGVSVEAARGQVRCVLGPNGTGKSTLLKALFGFVGLRHGEIRLNGEPARVLAPHDMGRNGVVYLPQWRPDPDTPGVDRPERMTGLAGVARKP